MLLPSRPNIEAGAVPDFAHAVPNKHNVYAINHQSLAAPQDQDDFRASLEGRTEAEKGPAVLWTPATGIRAMSNNIGARNKQKPSRSCRNEI